MTAILTCFLVGSLLSSVKGVLVKVAVNKPATLPCSVPNPDDNTVRWFKDPNTIISISEHIVPAFKKRMHISKSYKEEWNLNIGNVQIGDAGNYTCRVGDDVKEQVNLVVEVPPVIHDTHDTTFNEGDTSGTIWCNVTGSPTPTVRWFWKMPYQVDGLGQDSGVEGNRLVLHNITRYYDNIYVCLASNSVTDQREIEIFVNFGPEVEVLQNTVNATLGQEVTLHCAVEAYPMDGGLEWVYQNSNSPIHSNWKYEVVTDTDLIEDYNTLFVSMTIRKDRLGDGDYGKYICRTKNFSRGHSEKVVILQNPDEDENNVDAITRFDV